MSFKNFYNANANYYIENYSIGEFMFGYELEAFYPMNDEDKFKEFLNNAYDLNMPLSDDVEGHHDSWGHDCTIRADKGYEGVEFKSPPLYATPANLQKTIKVIDWLFSHGMRINSSCGFHVHVSFPHLTPVDTCWIIIQLSANQWYKKFTSFEGIQMFDDDYAMVDLFDNFYTRLNKEIKTKQDLIADINNYMYGDEAVKYDVISQHPQGTIEWRGPRGFADKGHDVITKFFAKMLPMFINYVTKALMMNEVKYNKGKGILTKKEFYAYYNKVEKKRPSEMMQSITDRKHDKIDRTFDSSMSEEDIQEAAKNNPWIGKGKFKNLKITSDGTMYSGLWYGGVFRGYVLGGTFDQRTAQLGSDAVWEDGYILDLEDMGNRPLSQYYRFKIYKSDQPKEVKVVK